MKGKGKPTELQIQTAPQRKLENELTIAKNKHLHNNSALPNIGLQCISKPKKINCNKKTHSYESKSITLQFVNLQHLFV